MMILAIDPGHTRSGWVIYDSSKVLCSGISANADVLTLLTDQDKPNAALAIEMIASYGMPVGREVFETVWWIGRFTQAWPRPDEVRLVYRRDIKIELCGSARAKDANVRAALIDRFGGKENAIGRKKAPGPLYGVSGDVWAALAVAVVVAGVKPPEAVPSPAGHLAGDLFAVAMEAA